MKQKLHVVILVPELREVAADDDLATLSTAHEVAKHYAALGHSTAIEHFEFDPTTFQAMIKAAKPDCVFNLVESVYARSRLIHLPLVYLEELGLPYTGCDAQSIFLSNDKVLAKRILQMIGVPSPHLFSKGLHGGRWIVKARHEHASFGITQENVVEDTAAACDLADKLTRQHDIEWMIEDYVEGREFNASIIEMPDGPRVLPIAEIEFRDYADGMHKIVDYAAKWDNGSFESTNTVRNYDFGAPDSGLLETLKDLSLKVWHGFGLNGWARVDYRVSTDGKAYAVDINANPDPSLDAGFMAAVERAGIAPPAAIDLITAAALRAPQGAPTRS